MKKLACGLTGQEFYISDNEVKYYLTRNLDIPNRSEVERLRSILSLIPLPKFIDSENYQENKDYSFSLFSPIAEVKEVAEIDVANFIDQLRSLVYEFEVSKSLKQIGNPLNFASFDISDSYDCSFCRGCSDSYELLSCLNCRNLKFSRFCSECTNSLFLENCHDCHNCIFCTNLTGKSFYVFNTEVSEAEFKTLAKELGLNNLSNLYLQKERFESFLNNQPVIYRQNVGFTKGYPLLSKNEPSVSFYSSKCENSASNFCCHGVNECFSSALVVGAFSDILNSALIVGKGRKIYRSLSCFGNIEDIDSSIGCQNSSHLFGCIGLNNSSYCILNKQCKKADYARLVQSIRSQLKDSSLIGQAIFSLEKILPYNNSLASLIFPLNKIQAELIGYKWDHSLDIVKIPEVDDCDNICEISGQKFSISDSEIKYLNDRDIALPNRSPKQRFIDRVRYLSLTPVKKTICPISKSELLTWDPSERLMMSSDMY